MKQKTGLLKWFFLAGFLLGILLGNIAGKDLLEDAGILSEYFIKQCKYREFQYDGLFWYLLEKRGTVFLFLVCGGLSMVGALLFRLYAFWTGFSFGIMYTASVLCFGAKGLLLITLAAFPHYILYVLCFCLLYYWMEKRQERGIEQRRRNRRDISRKLPEYLAAAKNIENILINLKI